MLRRLLKPSKFDRFQLEMLRRQISPPLLSLYRNMSFGSAAICLGLLIGIAQVKVTSLAVTISVFCASIALPLWILLALIFESYIVLGEQSHGHLDTLLVRILVGVIWSFAAIPMCLAVAGLVYFLNKSAFFWFCGMFIAATVLYVVFHLHLARWWYAPTGPGSTTENSSTPPKGH